ncbi:nitrate- and nitrite sensing domain-containing protein [Peterkaempfera sp. SMS 1(5)a]|uniref:sensor histidine kinase n=1 Tax=Peterkaempfera podocarpi TaxID=3232308 RepID=UPI00366C0BDF
MRRKQPVTPQRRPEPRQGEPGIPGAQRDRAAFTPFTGSAERPGTGPAAAGPSASGREAPQGPSSERPSAERTSSGAGGRDEQPPAGRLGGFSPRHWRVPTRLVAILLIPVVIALIFGGLRVNSSIDDYQAADRAEKTSRLAQASTALADALEQERDLSAVPIVTGGSQTKVTQLRQATDQALAAYNTAYKPLSDDSRLAKRNIAFQQLVASLPSLRENAFSHRLFPTATQNAYSVLIAPLMAYENEVGFGSSSVTSRGRAIYAIALAKASASTQRLLMTQLLMGTKTFTAPETTNMVQAIAVSNKLEEVSLGEFQSGTTDDDMRLYQQAVTAESTANASAAAKSGRMMPTVNQQIGIALAAFQAAASAQTRASAGQAMIAAAQQGLSVANWLTATSAHIQTYRTVESQLNNLVVGDAHRIKVRAQHDAILNSAIVLASLAVAGLLTGFVARSMIIGMRTLRAAALDIAGHRLPELVDRLSKTDPERVDTNVRPIPLHGRDEIGEVARAFDEVHRQAVRLASEQALLRGNVNAIFTNLSRRSQGLIQRQLSLITDLENNEADPDQLENLFKLDHLATRMRRNGENLLVLAGEEPGRRWNQPVPLVDVLRAAASEVEQYERIELSGIPEADVVGPAVTDLVHLLAELLENATTFSSPQTRVHVTATRLPDARVLVEIHDKGIGLTGDDFAEINDKLANPPTVDATISRRMGLFVVGRLAERHEIRVQLRPSGESAGTTSLVMLSAHLTQVHIAPEPEEEQFTVSRIFADQEDDSDGPFEQLRSAAELGFDDSRFERTTPSAATGFSPALDSMNRSLRLEQRRQAALEAGPSAAAGSAVPAVPAVPEYSEEEYQEPGQGYQQGQEYTRDYPEQEYAEQEYTPQDYPEQAFAPQAYQGDGYPAAAYADEGYPAQGFEQGGYPETYEAPQRAYAEEFPADPYAGGQFAEPHTVGYESGGYNGGAGNGYDHDGFTAAPPAAAAPASPAQTASGLPQRRPGQALAGGGSSNLGNRAIGGLEAGEKPNWFTGARETAPAGGTGLPGPAAAPEPASWQTPNDGSWERADQVREPSAGGVTSSGLPRRVPKQNLVPGNAQANSQDGPQISRAPEEVRGRLTNLRRGVQQGRSAGGDPSVTGSFRIDHGGNEQHGSTDLFGGSNHQER